MEAYGQLHIYRYTTVKAKNHSLSHIYRHKYNTNYTSTGTSNTEERRPGLTDSKQTHRLHVKYGDFGALMLRPSSVCSEALAAQLKLDGLYRHGEERPSVKTFTAEDNTTVDELTHT
eukprot:g53936.t1